MSISRPDPVNPPNLTFFNIGLTKTMTDLLIAWKITQKCLQFMCSKSFSYLVSISRVGPVNLSTATFPNITLTKTMTKVLVV